MTSIVRLGEIIFAIANDMEPANIKRPVRKGTLLAREEYDFSDVPAHEFAGCEFYEYARESPTIREDVARVRERLGHGGSILGIRKVWETYGAACEGFIFHALAKYSGFPTVPWVRLDAEQKRLLADLPQKASQVHAENFESQAPPLVFEPEYGLPALKAMTLGDWIARLDPPGFRKNPEMRKRFIVSGFFHINFTFPAPKLVEHFTNWLRDNHPTGFPKPKEKRGRPQERLNALGALRLRYHCRTLKEAQQAVTDLKTKKGGLYYADRKSWNRACDQAVERFPQCFPLLKEEPLHFSEGWPK